VPRLLPAGGRDRARVMDFALQVEAPATTRARRSSCSPKPDIQRASMPGIRAIPGFPTVAEAVVNDLNAAGIRVRLRSMERAAFYASWQEKKLRACS